MILEKFFRFKFQFDDCKTYVDLISRASDVIQEIETYRELDIKYTNNVNDYHHFEIETNDKRKIKRLKRMGFVKKL
tara:strand:+ start:369 stop:596 length:228 start_codon:yes stop_codon:yes gene_type:complete